MTVPSLRPRHADPASAGSVREAVRQSVREPWLGADRVTDGADGPGDERQGDALLSLLLERLAGSDLSVHAYALAEIVALADAHAQVRGTVVAAVCAYLRSPWSLPVAGPNGPNPSIGPNGPYPSIGASGEPEARRRAFGVLTTRLRDPQSPVSWCGHDLDLSGAVLAGADFSRCWFTGGAVRLEGAWAVEGGMSFDRARFEGSRVSLRHWTSGQGDLSFRGARFGGGVVSLAGAALHAGRISAEHAVIDGGTLAFTEMHLDGATVDLTGLRVENGLLSFADAHLVRGQVLLADARMAGGRTCLRHARITRGVLDTTDARVSPGSVDLTGSLEMPEPAPAG